MENGISITANRNEKKNYRGSMYLGFTAFFCGVISVILVFNGLNAISYTKEIVYLLAFYCLRWCVSCITTSLSLYL